MNVDLTNKLLMSLSSRPRIRKRYNASEIYAITHGWTTPEQWMSPPPREVKDVLLMWNGMGAHHQIQTLLGGRYYKEEKVEFNLDGGISLIAKADFLPADKPNEVWEFKTTDSVMDKAKPWAEYQVKLYCSLFNRPEGVVYQPVQSEKGLFLKFLGRVNRDDEWFKGEMQKLKEFDEKVEKLWEERLKLGL